MRRKAGRASTRRSSAIASLVIAGSVMAMAAATGGVSYGQTVQPGIAYKAEHHAGGRCTLAFLLQGGGHVYAATAGHCYSDTVAHDDRTGYLDYEGAKDLGGKYGSMDPDLEDVFFAHACPLPQELSLCRGAAWGKFVFALNNPAGDEGGKPSTICGVTPVCLGIHNPDLTDKDDPSEILFGDFGLIRLNKGVAHNPAMCLYGGPTQMYQHSVPQPGIEVGKPVPVVIYGQGAVGYNSFTDQPPYVPGQPGMTFPDETVNPWVSRYTYTGVQAFDLGQSGGPIMTKDGRALGVMGGINYADRLGPNIARAERYLNKKLTLFTAPLNPNAPLAGEDPDCTPRPAAASG